MTDDTLLSLREACERLGGISRPTLYKLLNRGDLHTIDIGRRRFIPAQDITAYIQRARG